MPPERHYYDDRGPLTPSARSRHPELSDRGSYLPPLRTLETALPSPVGRFEDRGYDRGYDERTSYSSRSSALGAMPHPPPSPYSQAYNSPIHGSYQGYYGVEHDGITRGPYPETKSTKYDPLGETGDSKSKKRRGNLPKPTTDILRAWFYEHLDHPYPSEQDKQMFMTRTGLTISQVST